MNTNIGYNPHFPLPVLDRYTEVLRLGNPLDITAKNTWSHDQVLASCNSQHCVVSRCAIRRLEVK